ncbi:MAG: AAA family ATPase, partial [Gammaproteobacteria bacterium]
GEHAWKIKKPLRLGFLDFGSLAARQHFCREEVRLNRRLAPAIYLDVVPIRGSSAEPRVDLEGEPCGDGDAEPIEYAVRMKQFRPGSLFAERLVAGTLEPGHIDAVALRLAQFHSAAPVAEPGSSYGSPSQIMSASNQALADLVAPSDDERARRTAAWLFAEGHRLRPEFERRKAAGKVRECHGDLHLANVLVLGDEVTAFDCIEFDPALRFIDLQSEVGFLAMDLIGHGRRDLAFRFLDAWLQETGDHGGLPVLRYYMVYRASVRALVARIREAQGDAAVGPDYLEVAQALISGSDPRLLITHGFSGSGKSFVSQRLLEGAGAIRLRSDVERKRLFGLHALDDSAARVAQGVYGDEATQRTYARLLELSATALEAGYRTIVDAAFLRAPERERFREAARERDLPFAILHCTAPPQVLRERVAARRASGRDPSEAGLEVLEGQLARHDPLSEDERRMAIEVDTTLPLDRDASRRWLDSKGPNP